MLKTRSKRIPAQPGHPHLLLLLPRRFVPGVRPLLLVLVTAGFHDDGFGLAPRLGLLGAAGGGGGPGFGLALLLLAVGRRVVARQLLLGLPLLLHGETLAIQEEKRSKQPGVSNVLPVPPEHRDAFRLCSVNSRTLWRYCDVFRDNLIIQTLVFS